MSVQWNQYILYGLKLPYVNSQYEIYESYLDSAYEGIAEKDGISAIYDGMNGGYVFVGKILHKSSESEPLDGPLSLTEPDLLARHEIVSKAEKLFGHGAGIEDVKIWFLTHYR